MTVPKSAELPRGSKFWALKTEDWWATWIGLIFFALGFVCFSGVDIVGWLPGPTTWMNPAKGLVGGHPMAAAMICGWIFITGILCIAAYFMEKPMKRFIAAFSIIYWITWACWFFPHNAYLAATKPEKFGIGGSAMLGGGAAYLVALAVGFFIGNVLRRQAAWLRPASMPEMFIKIAIVVLGIKIGLKCFEAMGIVGHILAITACSVVGAYLIIWPVTYYISRKLFRLGRDLSAVLATGMGICGVSAAIAASGSIKSRSEYPAMVIAAIVIFAVAELVLFPFMGAAWFWDNPIVPADWFGLAIKTDGAEAAAGGLLQQLAISKSAAAPEHATWESGWILTTAVCSKLFIDIFIGVWAFVLAWLWTYYVRRRPGERVERIEIWYRFPKFVIGFFATFLILLGISLASPQAGHIMFEDPGSMTALEGTYRHLFFMLTFTAIGINTDIRALARSGGGIGKAFACYAFCLFAVVIWIGLGIAYAFCNGFLPPTVG